ncbi:MAG: cytochrome c biogenesis protein CcdA [bacterium]|nr:cytochrome c biogenesis protein CcdA [bacterium]
MRIKLIVLFLNILIPLAQNSYGQPLVKLNKINWNFDKVVQGDIISTTILIKNSGKSKLNLNTRSSCDCLTSSLSKKTLLSGKLVAFTAGIFTFFTPCFFPLIPSYLTFITGLSFNDLLSDASLKSTRYNLLLNTLFFILGFSVIFIILGASITYLGRLLYDYQGIFKKVGGVIIILLGLYILGAFRIDLLQKEFKIHLSQRPLGFLGSFFVGITFAFGWSPCVGPILGSILIYASTTSTLYQGIYLLIFYSLGLAIPFLLVAILLGRFINYFSKLKKYLPLINKICGIFLVLIGTIIFFDKLKYFQGMF